MPLTDSAVKNAKPQADGKAAASIAEIEAPELLAVLLPIEHQRAIDTARWANRYHGRTSPS